MEARDGLRKASQFTLFLAFLGELRRFLEALSVPPKTGGTDAFQRQRLTQTAHAKRHCRCRPSANLSRHSGDCVITIPPFAQIVYTLFPSSFSAQWIRTVRWSRYPILAFSPRPKLTPFRFNGGAPDSDSQTPPLLTSRQLISGSRCASDYMSTPHNTARTANQICLFRG